MSFIEQYAKFVDAVSAKSAGEYRGEEAFKASRVLMSTYGGPQDETPAIHVAGTMGKGTITKLVTLMLDEHGKTSTAIMSPHTYSPCERILHNSENISEVEFAELIRQYHENPVLIDGHGMHVSRVLTLLGFLYARKIRPDYQIIETSMGGLYDATNTITRRDKVCVISQIGLDHTHILGRSLVDIAAHKAGIIHPGNSVVALSQDQEVNQALEQASVNNDLHWVGGGQLGFSPDDLNDSLIGDYQLSNVELALRSVQIVAERDGWKVDIGKIRSAVSRFSLPGRLEKVATDNRTAIMDTSHNQDELKGLFRTIRRIYGPDTNLGVVFASASRDGVRVQESLDYLCSIADRVLFTRYHAEQINRYRPASTAEQLPKSLAANVKWIPDHGEVVRQILESSEEIQWVVTGSTFLLPEIKPLLAA